MLGYIIADSETRRVWRGKGERGDRLKLNAFNTSPLGYPSLPTLPLTLSFIKSSIPHPTNLAVYFAEGTERDGRLYDVLIREQIDLSSLL